jgi:short-subunit dehydrogenase
MIGYKPLAVVTGASSGIGEVFARKFSTRGYRLLLAARRKERLEALAAELGNAEAFPADLADPADLLRLEQRISSEPALEFLVNNAGFGVSGRFYHSAVDIQEKMHRLHILATMRLTRAALAGMKDRRKGTIINVSSVAGFIPGTSNISYNATKAWMNNFTEGLYVELKSMHSPVRVQALCPGLTYSEFHDTAGVDRKSMPRSLWMKAEDVVDASLLGLEKNRLFVIPGWRYRLFIAIYHWLPQIVRHALLIKYERPASNDR